MTQLPYHHPQNTHRIGPLVEQASIEVSDGACLDAEIYYSTAPSVRGVFVFVHGFGGERHENGLFHSLAMKLVDEGFNSVLYDWRGIGKSDGDFRCTTLVEHESDFEDVVGWVRMRFPRLAHQISAVGFSLGAAVVGLALQRCADLNRVVYISPAARPRLSMWPRYNDGDLQREIQERGFVEKPGGTVRLGRAILDSLRDTDLGTRAFDIGIPLLVCHGTEDSRIACSHTRELVAAAGSASNLTYAEFVGASHSLRPADTHWQRLAAEVVGWLGTIETASRTLSSAPVARATSFVPGTIDMTDANGATCS